MSIYRCAMCGSTKIVPETKQEGYNKKKGIWGAVLFGGIGALAGTSGNTVTYYHCGDCGAVLNRTMLPFEKESIERCLASPDTFESSLKSYKERYKNIEWEEKPVTSISNNLTVSDIEERIIEYMKGKSVPVPCRELTEERLGIVSPVCTYELSDKEYDNYISMMDSLEMNMRSAIQNLRKRGIVKYEMIGDNPVYIFVTDIEEMKELALKESASEEVDNILKNRDYTKKIKEKLIENLPKCFMSLKEIYDFMETNNYLSDDVIRAVEKNPFVSTSFANRCILKLDEVYRNDKWKITRIRLFVWKGEGDNIIYRMKTLEELEEERQPVRDWTKLDK